MSLSLSTLRYTISCILIVAFIALLSTQLGTFFFLPFSFLSGIRIDYLAPAIYVTDILVILLILINIDTVVFTLRKPQVLLIGFLFGISVFFALSPEVGIYRYVKGIEWIGLFAVFKAYYSRPSNKLLQYTLVALFAGAMFQLILAVLQLINKSSLQGIFYWFGERYMTLSTPDVAKATIADTFFLRPYGTFSHPNSLGGFYLLIYFFVTSMPLFNSFPRLRGAILTSSLLLILLSFSKTAIICFFVLSIVPFARVVIEGKCKYCNVARIFVLLVVAGIFASSQGDPFNLHKRWTLVQDSVTIITQDVLSGTGPGNYLIAQNQFPIRYTTYFLQPVHNIALLFLAENGLVIGGAILALLYKPISALVRNKAFLYCAGVVLLSGMFDHYWFTLQQNFMLTAVVLGVIVGGYKKASLNSV